MATEIACHLFECFFSDGDCPEKTGGRNLEPREETVWADPAGGAALPDLFRGHGTIH